MDVQLLAVELSPKFVTTQATWQLVIVELEVQVLELVGVLEGAVVTSPPVSLP